MKRYFIDTNIFISILEEEKDHKKFRNILGSIHRGKSLGATSVICMAELLSGFYSQGERQKGDVFLNQTLSLENFSILDVDMQIAKEAAIFRSRYGIKLPDAIIAATCKDHRYILVTKDKAFRKIGEIQVL